MLSLIALEYRKLIDFRSVKLAVVVLLLLPWVWSFAPALQQVYNLVLVSGYQMPTLSLLTVMEFILPLLVSVTAAELIGAEVGAGTLAPLLLRPVSRNRVLTAKLVVALSYPFALLLVLLLASLLAGARFGLGGFAGGTGLGPGGFTGVGLIAPAAALAEIGRAYLIAAMSLMPIAALALLFAVTYLNTAAAALATIATLGVMRLLVVFPVLGQVLLTTHLDAYAARPETVATSLLVLLGYTALMVTGALLLFRRKDL
nr:ABC transporter permease [Deinobacterium chartae]